VASEHADQSREEAVATGTAGSEESLQALASGKGDGGAEEDTSAMGASTVAAAEVQAETKCVHYVGGPGTLAIFLMTSKGFSPPHLPLGSSGDEGYTSFRYTQVVEAQS